MNHFVNEPVVRILLPERLKSLGLKGAYYELMEDFVYVSDKYGTRTVKKGFISNLASIPRLALGYLNNDDPRISAASIIHDAGYAEKDLPRKDVDELLYEGMIVLGARPSMAWVVFRSVRAFGGLHWK